LFKHLPGGAKNVKLMFLKATNTLAVPIYVDQTVNINDIKVENNLTIQKVTKGRRIALKRLKKKALIDAKKKQKAEKNKTNRNKAATKRSLLKTVDVDQQTQQKTKVEIEKPINDIEKKKVEERNKKVVSKEKAPKKLETKPKTALKGVKDGKVVKPKKQSNKKIIK
jgi:hypothetical protein